MKGPKVMGVRAPKVMDRRFFLKGLGALAGGVALAVTGLGRAVAGVGGVFGAALGPCSSQRRSLILHSLSRIGSMTPDQLERALFESGLSEPFDLGGELSSMVEEGLLGQSVSADGLIYKLTSVGPPAGHTSIDPVLDNLKQQFEAERDYIAQYTESSTGVVPLFLSIRRGPAILMKVNLIVPDVQTAKTVTRNWRKNAHRTHQAVWDSIGEGLPFPKI